MSTRTPRRDTLVDREESTAKVPAYALSLARNLARSADSLQSLPYPVRRSGLHAVVPPPVRRRPVPLLLAHEDDEDEDDDETTSIHAPSVRLIAHSVPCVSDLEGDRDEDDEDDDDTDTDIGIEQTLRMASAPGPVAAALASGVVSVETFAAQPAQPEEEPLPPLDDAPEDPEPIDEPQYEPRSPAERAAAARAPIGTEPEVETKSDVKVEVIPILEPFPDVAPLPDLAPLPALRAEPANEALAEEVPAGLEARRPVPAFYWVASVAAVIGGCALTAALTQSPLRARSPHVFAPSHVTSCLAELARPASPPVVSVPVVKRGLGARSAPRAAAVRARVAAEPTGIVRDLPY